MKSIESKQQRFTGWMQRKWQLILRAFSRRESGQRTYRMGEIYYADLGTNVGGEIDKKRPVIVFQGTHYFSHSFDSVFVLPLTTNRRKKSYKVTLDITDIETESQNEKVKPSAIVLNQGRCVSKFRLMNYLGKVKEEKLVEIMNQFLFFLQKNTPLEGKPLGGCAVVQKDRDSESIVANKNAKNKLATLRKKVVNCDKQLLSLLSQRFDACKKIRLLKDQIHDPKRETELHQLWQEVATEMDISTDFSSALLELLLTESKRLQAES